MAVSRFSYNVSFLYMKKQLLNKHLLYSVFEDLLIVKRVFFKT